VDADRRCRRRGPRPTASARAGAAALAALLLLPATAAPAQDNGELVVTKTADTADGACDPDDCSLREAVIAANLNPGGNDVILLPAGTYRLTLGDATGGLGGAKAGDLDVTETVGIVGAGARKTVIDASGLAPRDRVFDFAPSSGFGFLELQGITITGGDAPGREAGGGVRAVGELDLFNLTLRGNRAFAGGGAAVDGRLLMSRSTVSGNTARGQDGVVGGDGGGLLLLHPTDRSEIDNSTISGNAVLGPDDRGAAIALGGEATLEAEFVTIAGNRSADPAQGAVAGAGQNGATFANSLLANAPTADCLDGLPVASGGHNLSGDDSCGFSADGDLASRGPRLGPLRNNGGPTDTHALRRGSPAIDGGGFVGVPPPDQRGVKRPQGKAPDIGAFERKKKKKRR
jgi:CSLREA domain-containing protein